MNLINNTNAVAVEIKTPDCNNKPVIPSSSTPNPPGINRIVPTIIGAKFVNVVSMKLKLRSNAIKQKYTAIASTSQANIPILSPENIVFFLKRTTRLS